MAKNIKGITIEIGGDTTKLQEALSSVNSKTKSLNSELKQINNLLKLDPSNTKLLAQKFDVLSARVKEAGKKLKILEEAQKDVNEQYRKGDIGEEQYRDFERQVEKARLELEKYEKQLDDVEDELKDVNNATKDVNNSTKKIGDASGKAANTSKTNWAQVTTGISSAMNIAESVISVFREAWDIGTQIGGFLGDTVMTFAQKADEFATNSKKYGVSTETLQKWEYASELVDVSTETMGGSLSKLTRSIKQYANESEEYTTAFDNLGIAVYDTNGQFRQTEDIFYDVIDALKDVENETEAEILANTLFGRSYQELEPLIQSGSDTLKAFGQEAEDLDLIMSNEQIENLNQANDAFDRLQSQLAIALLPLAEALAPLMEKMANWISEKLADPKVQETIENIAEAIGTLFESVAEYFAELIESGDFQEFIDGLIENIPKIADLVEGVIESFQGFADAIEKIAQFIEGLIGLFFDDTNGFVKIAESMGGLKDATNEERDAVYEAAEATNVWKNNWVDALLGINPQFDSFTGKVLTAGLNIGNIFSKIPNDITKAFSNIKVPSPHWVGKFSLNPPSMPHIEWYGDGGIFNTPQIIGVGERGSEAVLPIEKLTGIMANALSLVGGSGNNVNINMNVQSMTEAQQNAFFKKVDKYLGGKLVRAY